MTRKIVGIVVAVLLVVVACVACSSTPAASSAPAASSVAPAASSAAPAASSAAPAASSVAPASSAAASAASAAPVSKLVFADLAYNMADVWDQFDVQASQWAAQQKGVTLKVSDATNDPEKQVSQAQTAINEKVDGIILFPCTPDSAATIVRMANAATPAIPVAIENIFLSDAQSTGVVGQVACQYHDIGYAAIKYAATTYPGAKLLYVHGGAGMGVYEDYKVGTDQALKDFAGKVTQVGLIDGKWDTADAQNVTQDFIASGKSTFNIVFANNGLEAVGVYNALKANNMTNIPIISTGGSDQDLQMMQAGTESANMTAPVNIQGVISFDFLWDKLNNVAFKNNKIPLPIIAVDKSNISQWIKWEDYPAADAYVTQNKLLG
jgi:ribose transport system substrate-binding protein